MTVYDTPERRDDEAYVNNERMVRAGYRPGWVWLPLAVTLLLIILVVATGFIFGGYNDRTRAFDNGTRLEQVNGDTTMPGLPTPVIGQGAPEDGLVNPLDRPLVRPEEAPPLANDGQ